MTQAVLLGRTMLKFGADADAEAIIGDLSAAAFAPDGSLWLASDELSGGRIALSRMTPQANALFAEHRLFPIDDYVDLLDDGGETSEADIEGLDYADGYLWFTGSHSSKRRRPKGKAPRKDLQRLAEVRVEHNRCLLGRIPLHDGVPAKRAPHPLRNSETLSAARLKNGAGGNVLIEALRKDAHLGPFLKTLHADSKDAVLPLAGKENGFDVEGLAVFGRRLFLGLRGPVLRGWAILLEIEVEDHGKGRLDLVPIAEGGQRFRKHFLDLDGLGIRELGCDGEDLLILAGPTMTLEGALRMFRLCSPRELNHDSITGHGDGRLSRLFDLPVRRGGDNAEGFAALSWRGQPALFVVYDSPLAERRPAPGAVFADVFWLHA